MAHRVSTAPLKPPGVFKRSGSTHSLVSTAASVTGDSDDDKYKTASPVLLSSGPPPAVGRIEKSVAEVVPHELRVEDLGAGHLKVVWPMDARKVQGKDQQLVSPSFELFPGFSFKLLVKPRPMGDRKGQASFKKSRGWSSVELKLMGGMALAPKLRFLISVGGSSPRGPVDHDFSDNTMGGLVNDNCWFDFASAVEPNSSTILVSLEVLAVTSKNKSAQSAEG